MKVETKVGLVALAYSPVTLVTAAISVSLGLVGLILEGIADLFALPNRRFNQWADKQKEDDEEDDYSFLYDHHDVKEDETDLEDLVVSSFYCLRVVPCDEDSEARLTICGETAHDAILMTYGEEWKVSVPICPQHIEEANVVTNGFLGVIGEDD